MKAGAKVMTKGGSRSSECSCKRILLQVFLFRDVATYEGHESRCQSDDKGAIAAALAEKHELKKTVCSKVINSLSAIATEGVKSAGKFVIPGVCQIKTRQKPATKAGKKMIFGKEVMVKAKPAKTVVKAFPVAALKK